LTTSFSSWLAVEFKLYQIKEFQRLKDEELKQRVGISSVILQKSIIVFTLEIDSFENTLSQMSFILKAKSLVYTRYGFRSDL
jgi:hypothetical protein